MFNAKVELEAVNWSVCSNLCWVNNVLLVTLTQIGRRVRTWCAWQMCAHVASCFDFRKKKGVKERKMERERNDIKVQSETLLAEQTLQSSTCFQRRKDQLIDSIWVTQYVCSQSKHGILKRDDNLFSCLTLVMCRPTASCGETTLNFLHRRNPFCYQNDLLCRVCY